MTHLHELDLPNELIYRIHQFVGPHPLAVLIRDLCEDIEFDGEESLMPYMGWYREWEMRLRIRCLQETISRLVEERPNGTYVLNAPPHGADLPLSNMQAPATLWGVHDISQIGPPGALLQGLLRPPGWPILPRECPRAPPE